MTREDEKIREMELDIREIKSSMIEIVANFKNMNEKLTNSLDSHDKVIRIAERQKMNEERYKTLAQENKELHGKVTNVSMKMAALSGAISFVVGLLSNFAK